MKKSEFKNLGKGWICDQCAKEKKWGFPEGCVTTSEGICDYCNGEKQVGRTLTPIIDFDRPGKPAVWD